MQWETATPFGHPLVPRCGLLRNGGVKEFWQSSGSVENATRVQKIVGAKNGGCM